jgi:hypothetical protein
MILSIKISKSQPELHFIAKLERPSEDLLEAFESSLQRKLGRHNNYQRSYILFY